MRHYVTMITMVIEMLKRIKYSQKFVNIMLLIALGFLIAGFATYIVIRNKYSGFITGDLFIESLDHESETSFVYYYFDGVLYEHAKIITYDEVWETGQKIRGLINPNNPQEIVAIWDLWIIPAIIFVGSVLSLAIVFPLVTIKTIITEQEKRIKKRYTKVISEVINVQAINNYSLKKLVQFETTYHNDFFYSPVLFGKFAEWVDNLTSNNFIVDLYIHPEKPYKYFVDYTTIRVGKLNEDL